jgi:hypothetical protein
VVPIDNSTVSIVALDTQNPGQPLRQDQYKTGLLDIQFAISFVIPTQGYTSYYNAVVTADALGGQVLQVTNAQYNTATSNKQACRMSEPNEEELEAERAMEDVDERQESDTEEAPKKPRKRRLVKAVEKEEEEEEDDDAPVNSDDECEEKEGPDSDDPGDSEPADAEESDEAHIRTSDEEAAEEPSIAEETRQERIAERKRVRRENEKMHAHKEREKQRETKGTREQK